MNVVLSKQPETNCQIICGKETSCLVLFLISSKKSLEPYMGQVISE